MDRTAFLARYGEVFEHSPWVATRAFDAGICAGGAAEIHAAFMDVLMRASADEQLGVINAHPELGARVALTDASANEQMGAGLRALSAPAFARFEALNMAYRARFGFPFIICVREHDAESILAAFTARLANDAAQERATALAEIGKIARLRLGDLETTR
ncbi:MAG: 2-oxo-4-hydroxy-4-carboxy-5-ureidoimidazoline decarboxylase [Acidocella sp.]|nr:2-oxo-4-hydroxy-4-carboxy-5-ureidoimidazoline decarboxylase [Acidocella sp.]